MLENTLCVKLHEGRFWIYLQYFCTTFWKQNYETHTCVKVFLIRLNFVVIFFCYYMSLFFLLLYVESNLFFKIKQESIRIRYSK